MNPVSSQNSLGVPPAVAKPITASIEKKVQVEPPSSTTPIEVPRPTVTKGQDSAVSGNTAVASQEDAISKTVAQINDYVQQIQRDLRFSVDEDTGRTVIKVIDSESKDVVRQIPAEKLLEIAKNIEKSLEGVLIEDKA